MSTAPENAVCLEIALRWSDQDLLGHVNNAKIMTLVEEARIRTLAQLQEQLTWDGPVEMVLRTTTTDFLRPVMYEGLVKVNVWVSRIGNTSYVMHHELLQHGEIAATVEAVVVMFDNTTQRPMPIPDAVRTVLTSIATSSVAAD